MKTLAAGIDARKEDRSYSAAYLIEMVGASTYRYTNYKMDLTFDSNTYYAKQFYLGAIVEATDGSQAVEVGFEDQDQVITAILVANTMREWTMTLTEVWIENDAIIANGDDVKIIGLMDGIELNEEGLNSRLTMFITDSGVPDTSIGPRQEYGLNCRFQYKDAFCAATAPETTCDKTWGACGVRSNRPRFGAFRYAPTPLTRIKWGDDVDVFIEERFRGTLRERRR